LFLVNLLEFLNIEDTSKEQGSRKSF